SSAGTAPPAALDRLPDAGRMKNGREVLPAVSPARTAHAVRASRGHRSNSPSLTPPMNASHSLGVKIRTGPSWFLLSRMPTYPPERWATSTQAPLLALRALFFQTAPERSTAFNISSFD